MFRLPDNLRSALPVTSGVPFSRSLSVKILLLTIAFIMLAEVLVFIPSVSRYRNDWLQDHVNAAYLASLSFEVTQADVLEPALVRRLLRSASVDSVRINREGRSELLLAPPEEMIDEAPQAYVDLLNANWANAATDSVGAMFRREERMLTVRGAPQDAGDVVLDIMVRESELRRDLIAYGRNILGLSFAISVMTAALVYGALLVMVVAPIVRLTANMADYVQRPDDRARVLTPSGRSDEIGMAERVLARMQTDLRDALRQRERLAALGAGVSKISHDLRNVLASAQLMSDRLAGSEDPRVQKLAPRLIQALDRAISLCRDTLLYGRAGESTLRIEAVALDEMIEEIVETVGGDAPVEVAAKVPHGLEIKADRTQIFRVVSNLVRNAVQVLTEMGEGAGSRPGRVVVSAWREAGATRIEVADDGPGVPEEARAHLFEAFKGSVRQGGTGLGLAIAHEIVRAHGGALRLARTGPEGTVFEVVLPDRAD